MYMPSSAARVSASLSFDSHLGRMLVGGRDAQPTLYDLRALVDPDPSATDDEVVLVGRLPSGGDGMASDEAERARRRSFASVSSLVEARRSFSLPSSLREEEEGEAELSEGGPPSAKSVPLQPVRAASAGAKRSVQPPPMRMAPPPPLARGRGSKLSLLSAAFGSAAMGLSAPADGVGVEALPEADMLWVVEGAEKVTYSVGITPDGLTAMVAGIRTILVLSGRTGSRLHTIDQLDGRPLALPNHHGCVRLLSPTQVLIGGEHFLSVSPTHHTHASHPPTHVAKRRITPTNTCCQEHFLSVSPTHHTHASHPPTHVAKRRMRHDRTWWRRRDLAEIAHPCVAGGWPGVRHGGGG